jgi:hypothetical protein
LGRRSSVVTDSAVKAVDMVAVVPTSASASADVAVVKVAVMRDMTQGSRRLGRG